MADTTYVKDPRVDAYIDALPEWQQRICQQVRDLVHGADPEVVETIKRTVQPYFVLDGNVAALLSAKDHVTVFLYDGGLAPDPEGIITGGHGNQTGRMIAIRRGETINGPALTAIFTAIIADNRAGGCGRSSRDAEAASGVTRLVGGFNLMPGYLSSSRERCGPARRAAPP